MSGGVDRTNIKNVEDPIDVLPPSGNHAFIIFAESLGGRFSYFFPENLPLDLGNVPAIMVLVSGLSSAHVAASTHVVSCWIAPRTDGLRSLNRLPSKPLSRALHTSAQ